MIGACAFLVALTVAGSTSQAGARFGHCVSSADVNGDGFGDVIVGEPWYDGAFQDAGRVLVHLGSPSGPSPMPDWSYTGRQAGALLGKALAGVGDLNGDGYDEIVVAAPEFDARPRTRIDTVDSLPASPIADAGIFLVFAGTPDGPTPSPVFTRAGTEPGQLLGTSIARAGDLDGDGRADFVVGAPLVQGPGAAHTFHGSAAAPIARAGTVVGGTTPGGRFGFAVGGGGDVNGDGFDDVVVGAPDAGALGEGEATLFTGSASGLVATPLVSWGIPSCAFASDFGASVAIVPATGFARVIVGDPLFDVEFGPGGSSCMHVGTAALFRGTASGIVFDAWLTPEDTPRSWGVSVASAGRVNGDGVVDYLVGSTSGLARVFTSRPFNQPHAAHEIVLGGPTTQGGYSVTAAGDVDGDGRGDVLVSEPAWDGAFVDTGRVHVFRGLSSGVDTTAAWTLAAP